MTATISKRAGLIPANKLQLLDYHSTPNMKGPLTFGVEFEFSIAAAPEQSLDPHPTHPGRFCFPDRRRAHPFKQYLNDTLRKAGLPTQRQLSEDSRFWYVTTDPTVLPPHRDAPCQSTQYTWHPMEVVSPALYFGAPALDQLRVACAALSSSYRVVPVRSAGLHVHVGNGVAGFDVPTVRNLIALLWVFEPQLLTLHPPHRHRDQWCAPLRQSSVYARRLQKAELEPQTALVLEDFFSEEFDLQRLCQELTHFATRKCAVKFSNLIGSVDGTKRTIEFRQHAGTLDGEAAVMWVRTVVGLVEWARDVELVAFAELMTECAEVGHEEFTAVQLLRRLKLEEQADYYSSRLHLLGTQPDNAGNTFQHQNFAEPRTQVLERFGIGRDGVAPRGHTIEDVVFKPL